MTTNAPTRHRLHTPLFAIALVGAIACGPKSDKAPTPPVAEPVAPAPAPEPVVPMGPDAEQTLTWVLDTVKSGGPLSDADIDARFAPSFLKQVPPERVNAVLKQISKELGSFKIIKKEGEPPLKVTALLDTQAGVVRVTIGLTSSAPRKVETLLFKPASTEAPPTSYAMVVDQLKKAGETSQFYVAELVKGKCTARQNHNVKQRMAIASTVKLYVLLALAKKVRGRTTWDTKLPIRDDLKSLPTGVLQTKDAGTQLTLREYATKMMSISDNTATDHLIEFIGKKNVLRAFKTAKHSNIKANTPLMTTREFFALKLASTDDERAAYRKARLSAKTKQLAAMRKKEVTLASAAGWKTPRDLDIEWFADAADLCGVWAALVKAGKADPSSELLTALSKNPGVPFSKEDWKYLGYKGGGEPGVMSMTWLGKRADDRWFVVVVSVNDSAKALDEKAIVNASIGALNVLGKER